MKNLLLFYLLLLAAPGLPQSIFAANLNGMDLSKGQILPIGEGKSEAEMIQELGFKGRIGVLGHRDDEDVEVVLKRNLEGLKQLLK